MTREQKVARARELREGGALLREIADTMGVAKQTVHAWLADPDLSKQRVRRARYSRPCADCGKPTDGSGGYADPRARCSACAHVHKHETRRWTPERIVEAIQAFHTAHGRPPTAVERLAGRIPDFPSVGTVQDEFGSWNEGICAAGLEPLPSGHKLSDYDSTTRDRALALYRSGLSTHQVGARLGVSGSAVGAWARRAGITRPRSEAQLLRRGRAAA